MPEGTAGIAVEIYLYTAYYYGKIRIKKKEVIIMIPNRHISNLKNRFPETGKSVDDVEIKLDEADRNFKSRFTYSNSFRRWNTKDGTNS